MTRVQNVAAIGALALLAFFLAACGGSDDDDPSIGPPPNPPVTATPTIAPANAASICAATHRIAGTVQSPELIEISGIAASRRNAEVIWAHNDSGDAARFFAMTTEGATLGSITEGGSVGTFNLVGAQAVDWEAMAVGPGPDEGTYLYFGDIGDNDAKRSEIVVYRVPEPAVAMDIGTPIPQTDITEYDTLTLTYPDGAHDAETLLVDPISSDLLIVTKNIATGVSHVFRGDASAPDGDAAQELELVGTIDFAALRDQIVVPEGAPPLANGLRHIPTGGDVSPDGSLVAIRTYGSVFVWERPDGARLWEAFDGEPCQATSVIEEQGEAIAFGASGNGYITISEGMNPAINAFAVE